MNRYMIISASVLAVSTISSSVWAETISCKFDRYAFAVGKYELPKAGTDPHEVKVAYTPGSKTALMSRKKDHDFEVGVFDGTGDEKGQVSKNPDTLTFNLINGNYSDLIFLAVPKSGAQFNGFLTVFTGNLKDEQVGGVYIGDCTRDGGAK